MILAWRKLSGLRTFLRGTSAGTGVHRAEQPCKITVVIDHHAAHVYQHFGGSRLAEEQTIRPYDPFGFHHHLVHRKEDHYRSERIREENSFYEAVANDLVAANDIVIIGHGQGKSNAATYLNEYLASHHPDVFRRIRASERADLSAVTEPELEALAEKYRISGILAERLGRN